MSEVPLYMTTCTSPLMVNGLFASPLAELGSTSPPLNHCTCIFYVGPFNPSLLQLCVYQSKLMFGLYNVRPQ